MYLRSFPNYYSINIFLFYGIFSMRRWVSIASASILLLRTTPHMFNSDDHIWKSYFKFENLYWYLRASNGKPFVYQENTVSLQAVMGIDYEAQGPDNIQAWMLRELAPFIAQPVTAIFASEENRIRYKADLLNATISKRTRTICRQMNPPTNISSWRASSIRQQAKCIHNSPVSQPPA